MLLTQIVLTVFDIYYKPTISFSYPTYSSCHLSHPKNNVALSLAKQIINIITDNIKKRLSELKSNLIENHAPGIIYYLPNAFNQN